MIKTICGVTYVMVSVFTLPATLHSADDAGKKVGYLGVEVFNPSVDEVKGPYIGTIVPDGPAARAGIRRYDIILAVDDMPIPDAITFVEKIASLRPGKEIHLKIWRRGKEIPLKATLGGRPLFKTNLLQEDPPRVLGATYDATGSVGNFTAGGNVIVHRGKVHVKGRFEQRWTSVLDIHIDRRENYPHLQVDGDLYLAGILYVGISKIQPGPGAHFELIRDAKSLHGRFGKVMLPEVTGAKGRIVYDDLEKKQDLDGDGKYDVTLVFEAPNNATE